MLFFLGQIFPYISITVFLTGMTWRLLIWLNAPVPFQLTLFPAPKTFAGRVMSIGWEIISFESLWRGDRILWLWAWLMHGSLAVIIVGHIVGIYTLTLEFTLIGLSPEASSALSAGLGITTGTVCFLSLMILFYRRTAIDEVKRLSDPVDYFVLLLLLAIVISGMHMRLTSLNIDLTAIRSYLAGILTLHPIPIPRIWIFVSHFTLVNILLIYFPFSKLFHGAGFVVNRGMLTEKPPIYPTPATRAGEARFNQGVRT
jgi:nitrate reductase gamma subunit